uniref:Lipid-binding serum glycoprotein N-terminal domain-containing protein n=1 Tax=Anopheles farauti TaxID=69004 RepID=A0A182Q5T8_9DIPT
MQHGQQRTVLLGLVTIALAAVGSVAPAEDPLAGLLGTTFIGGKEVSGPISIRNSIIGDIISISVNVNSTIRANVSAELLQVLVCALNEYGDYGITMSDVRKALTRCILGQFFCFLFHTTDVYIHQHPTTSFAVSMVIASGDPITISGNTIGDLVNVNVNVTANIQNEINQDYVNVLALLMSSTGDVDLFRKLTKALEEKNPSSIAASPNATEEKVQPSQPKEEFNVEEAIKQLFPKLINKQ